MTKSKRRRRTSSTSLPICQTDRCFGPSRSPTRSTESASSATPAISTTDAAPPPTMTVTRARGNFCLIAASAYVASRTEGSRLLVVALVLFNLFDGHLQTRVTPAARGEYVAHGVG